MGFTDGSDLVGWTYSVYLQDEWKVIPTVTVNFGARFDAISGATSENQLSPRVNVVWEPDPQITLRAGYARYFVPAPLNQVNPNSLAVRAGTTARARGRAEHPGEGRALRLFRRRPDREARRRPDRSASPATTSSPQNYLDKGQFGAPISLDLLQLRQRAGEGLRAVRQLRQGPVVALRQPRLVRTSATNINSAQFNF